MTSFRKQLQTYKQRVDTDVRLYARHVRTTTRSQYGQYPAVVNDAFLDMLERGGKRLRGTLVLAGYEMCGGRDEPMIVRAATALEMVHASLLILDDIQDRSSLRRGRPTVHEVLRTYHIEQDFRGDAAHTGTSLAINAALTGCQAAQMLIAGLQVDALLRSNALGIIAHAIMTTAQGQTLDFVQELTGTATMESIEQTMEWKTAYYTVLNPLCVGMVLAGVGCEDTDAIRSYALHTGKAFQVTDDIIGIFGSQQQTGKSVLDDMREGKQTVLTVYAALHASTEDQAFLKKCLGDTQLSTTDFAACQRIFKDCGALAYAEAEAEKHVDRALTALDRAPDRWSKSQIIFLRELATGLLQRKT